VQEALTSLPCVEAGSIKVDVSVQQARFTVKDKTTCSMQEVTKAIENVGFTVADVKLTP
jgi:copper chaperone CopZ